jgi:hypothetical protein
MPCCQLTATQAALAAHAAALAALPSAVLLLSPAAADRLADAGVMKAVRGQEKASDHAPAFCVLR